MGSSHNFRVFAYILKLLLVIILAPIPSDLGTCAPQPPTPEKLHTTRGTALTAAVLKGAKSLLSYLPENIGLWIPNAKRFYFFSECECWKNKLKSFKLTQHFLWES